MIYIYKYKTIYYLTCFITSTLEFKLVVEIFPISINFGRRALAVVRSLQTGNLFRLDRIT